MPMTTSLRTLIPALILALALSLGPACSDDNEPRADQGPTSDLYQPTDGAQPDSPAKLDGAACKEGDKRCDGLEKIERCQGGAWVPYEDCSKKSMGGHSCTCSMTLMWVCAAGGNECL